MLDFENVSGASETDQTNYQTTNQQTKIIYINAVGNKYQYYYFQHLR